MDLSELSTGSIVLWPCDFAPRNWMFCHGQTLQIADYASLFSLLGTTYGGDGMQTFKLPDLRGRVPVGAGQGSCPPQPSSPCQSNQPSHCPASATLGKVEDVTAAGTNGTPALGVNYIICAEGVYPSRDRMQSTQVDPFDPMNADPR